MKRGAHSLHPSPTYFTRIDSMCGACACECECVRVLLASFCCCCCCSLSYMSNKFITNVDSDVVMVRLLSFFLIILLINVLPRKKIKYEK